MAPIIGAVVLVLLLVWRIRRKRARQLGTAKRPASVLMLGLDDGGFARLRKGTWHKDAGRP